VRARRWYLASAGCLGVLLAAGVVLKGCMSFGPRPEQIAAAFHGHAAPSPVDWRFEGKPMRAMEVGDPRLPLVVFVHGTPGDWTAFLSYLADPELTRVAHMISVDRLGFGGSEAGGIETSLARQAAALAPLLERDGAGRGAVLIGHSLGAPIIARMAMDHPARVAGLIIVAGSCDPALERRTWYQRAGMSPWVRWLLPRELDRANVEMVPLKDELEAMVPRWAEIRVPVTVIQGGRDSLVPPANADFLARVLSNAPVRMVRPPEATHFLVWEQPGLVRDAILEQITIPPSASRNG
jgi:pimeloyl-ACP methyl ester carboxylesterase